MTATLILPNKTKITYCAIWTEFHSGRSGNDIASALISILSKLVHDFPHLTRITLWSDSCVPQNRNSVTSTAIKAFLAEHPQIIQIIQKFSEPGHSNIQEIDSVHSVIDRYLKHLELYSPQHLIQLLSKISSKKTKLVIIEMAPENFKNYAILVSKLEYKKVPFSKIKSIFYEYSVEKAYSLKYKKSFADTEYQTIDLTKRSRTLHLNFKNIFSSGIPISQKRPIATEKIKDITELLPFIPVEHQNSIKNLFNLK